jgi:gas vesicle protein
MGTFTNGLLLGVGIGLLVAPMRGEEMRRMVSQRVANIRTSLSQNGQGSQYIQQASDTLSHTANALKENAQQAVSQVRSTGSALADTTQKATTDVQQTGQDVAEATKRTALSTTSKTSGSSTSL